MDESRGERRGERTGGTALGLRGHSDGAALPGGTANWNGCVPRSTA